MKTKATGFVLRGRILILLVVFGLGAAVAGTAAGSSAGSLLHETKLAASDAAAADLFGAYLAASGDTLVVGGKAAYVFVRTGGVWIQQQKLTSIDGGIVAGCVAVSGDTAVVGTGNAAYVFVRSGAVWNQQQKLTPSDAGQGYGQGFSESVAVSGDVIVVGAPRDHGESGSAYFFMRSGGAWTQVQKLRPPWNTSQLYRHFGASVALSGETLVVGAPTENNPPGALLSGAAYVFHGYWDSPTRLTASDAEYLGGFGTSVAVDGDRAVIGSRSNAAYVFGRSGDVWSQQQKLAEDVLGLHDSFGLSVAVSGDTAVVGARQSDDAGLDSGSAFVFVRSDGVWIQQDKLTPTDGAAGDTFGMSVAVIGGSPVVGAPAWSSYAPPSHGSVYVYDFPLTALGPVQVWVGLKNSDDVGIRFDLLARVSLSGVPVGSGQLDGVLGGSSGFTNAKLNSIPLTLSAPVAVPSGDTLSIELLVRNACSGSGKNSGTARLWYDGQPVDSGTGRDAGSRFDATIGLLRADYFLRQNFDLDTTAGSSRLYIDEAVGAKCGGFTSFETWTTTLP